MKASVNQNDIARDTGFSRSAVSFALNPRLRTRLPRETSERILAAARRLGYRPHRQAQLMRGVKSGVIGMIKPIHMIEVGVERAFFASKAIYAAGYGLTANELLWSAEGLKRAVDAMLDVQVEGVLLEGVTEKAATGELRRLRDAQIPVVSLGGMRWPSIPFVNADFRQGMADLTRHVLAAGYRKLVFVSGQSPPSGGAIGTSSLEERAAGFRDAAVSAGLKKQEARIIWHPRLPDSFDNYEPGREAAQHLIESGDLPDALLCGNDSYAIGAMGACAAAGLRVPRDIAITGFDDTLAGRYVFPPLATVAQPTEAMAKRAVELLLKQMRGDKLSAGEKLINVPCTVVVRQSCGAAAASLKENERPVR